MTSTSNTECVDTQQISEACKDSGSSEINHLTWINIYVIVDVDYVKASPQLYILISVLISAKIRCWQKSSVMRLLFLQVSDIL